MTKEVNHLSAILSSVNNSQYVLLERKNNLLKEINKLKQATNIKEILDTNLTDEEKKKNRIIAKIKELESRQKLNTLNTDEIKVLESAKKELKKLDAKAGKGNVSTSKTIQKKSTRTIENIKDDLKMVEQELLDLALIRSFEMLFALFSNMPRSKKINRDDKLTYIVKKLENEIKNLKDLHYSNVENQRNYASEHCIAIIGQLLRDMEDCKSNLVKEILQNNLTIKQSIEQNIIARNKKVMHDPFNDNSLHLASIIANETLPLHQDISAIKAILSFKDKESIEDSGVSNIIKTYSDLGYACMRLKLLVKSEEFYLKALIYTSPEYYAKSNLKNLGITQQEDEPIVVEQQFGATYITRQGEQVIIAENDPIWVQNKIIVLVELSQCLMRQGKFLEAKKHLQNAFDIYKAHSPMNKAILCKILENLLIATFNSDASKLDSFSKELEFLKENDYKGFVLVCIHYANMSFSLDKVDAANKRLAEIDYKKIKDIRLLINIYLMDGIIFFSEADEIDKKLGIDKLVVKQIKVCSQSLDMRSTAIAALKEALKLYEENLSTLKSSEGDYFREIFNSVTLNLSMCIGSQAARIVSAQPEKAYEFIKEALKLQIEFGHDTSTSYSTLGAACEKMYEKTSNLTYLDEGLKAYDKNASHENIKVRAISFSGKAAILNSLIKYEDTIACLLEAKLFYSLLPEQEKNSYDETEEKWIKDLLAELSITQRNEYVNVLTKCEKNGDLLNEDDKFKQAIEFYKKCLFGLEYLVDMQQMKKRIELKLTTLINKQENLSNKEFFASKQQMWKKQDKKIITTSTVTKSQKNGFCGFKKGFL